LGDWAATCSSGGGQLVAMDLLVFIKVLTYSMADFGCATQKLVVCMFCDLGVSPFSVVWSKKVGFLPVLSFLFFLSLLQIHSTTLFH
jgi:hypothetical protein